MLAFQGGSIRLRLAGSALARFWEVLGLLSGAPSPEETHSYLTVTNLERGGLG